MRRVLIEIFSEAIGGDDDRILLEAPARRFLLSRQELKARRLDRGEAFFLRRSRRRRDRATRVAAARSNDQRRG